MALTEKGNELLGILQKLLEQKGDHSDASVEEIAEFGGMSVHSVRGRLSKLQKEGYLTSNPVENEEGKKRKRIALTEQGWEVDVENYTPPTEE
jgi:DNA-binding MarR family transcriptional regulator